jgi:glyoxylase-like metal-dependent hydrolase (beta-lactamase superfamily II)
MRLLDRYLEGSIEALVISHNDADHDGAAARLFEQYASRIKHVCFLRDRPPRRINLLSLVVAEQRSGRFRGRHEASVYADDAAML